MGSAKVENPNGGATGWSTELVPAAVPAEGDPFAVGAPRRTKKGKRKRGDTGTLHAEELVQLIPVAAYDVLLEPAPVIWKPMQMSEKDKAPSVVLKAGTSIKGDNITVESRKGYRMARATHGCHSGAYYFEVYIENLGTSGHCRLGWATRDAELQAPVGYDEYSYAYRDAEGVKVHKSLREPYGEPYRVGDVIGCYLHLPEGGRPLRKTHQDVVAFKGKPFIQATPEEKPPQVLQGSLIAFTLNGAFQGVAYRDLKEGTYYPAVSLYTAHAQPDPACVTMVFNEEDFYSTEPFPEREGCPPPRPASELAGTPDAPIIDNPTESHEDGAPDTAGNGALGVVTQVSANSQTLVAAVG